MPSSGRKAELVPRLLEAPDLRERVPRKRTTLPAELDAEAAGPRDAVAAN